MTEKEFYDRIGGSYSEALERLMKDSLIRKFVLKYPGDPSFSMLSDALAAKDWDEAFRAVHTLKGVALNLAFKKLGGAAQELTELLRPQTRDVSDPARIDALFGAIKAAYDEVISAIGELNA